MLWTLPPNRLTGIKNMDMETDTQGNITAVISTITIDLFSDNDLYSGLKVN